MQKRYVSVMRERLLQVVGLPERGGPECCRWGYFFKKSCCCRDWESAFQGGTGSGEVFFRSERKRGWFSSRGEMPFEARLEIPSRQRETFEKKKIRGRIV